jgi:DNA-binding CsgD family transcriptional regulator
MQPGTQQDDKARLAPRQRECMAMFAAHISPKQIARDLDLSENTVRGYLAEAVKILGARDLRDAARLFLASENNAPQKLGERNQRVDEAVPDRSVTGPEDVAAHDALAIKANAIGAFHFLRGNRRRNELTVSQRLLWIVIGSVTALVLFATSAFALGELVKLATELKG